MLAGELQRYNQRVQSGEVPQQPSPSQQQPPPLGGAHVPAALSQSLPSGGGHLHGMRVPPQPRMRPRAPPTMAGPPILELPEQSPHSSSLLDSHPLRPAASRRKRRRTSLWGERAFHAALERLRRAPIFCSRRSRPRATRASLAGACSRRPAIGMATAHSFAQHPPRPRCFGDRVAIGACASAASLCHAPHI